MKEKELFERLLLSNLMSKNSSLLFTVEQWELVRRLKSSGITKEQICQAFDDLDKMENDLTKYTNMKLLNESNTINTNLNSSSSSSSSIGFNLNNNNNEINSTATSTQIVNAYFATMINSSDENKELEDFKKYINTEINIFFLKYIIKSNYLFTKRKGDAANQNEISCCVHKYDLKQSQISRMAGVNQAYVSKFLRGEFYEMSENAKILIFKWYLRFLKNPTIFLHAFNVALNPNTVNLEISQKYNNFTLPTNSFLNVTNTSYDVTKRATFRFKPEHLEVSFISIKNYNKKT